jgi:hypothetical protein
VVEKREGVKEGREQEGRLEMGGAWRGGRCGWVCLVEHIIPGGVRC